MTKEDLTIIYYTANEIPEHFAHRVRETLKSASKGIPIITMSKQPTDFGTNLVTTSPRSHVGIYRDCLIGAKAAKTKYIAFCEDDTFYVKEHFEYRPTHNKFGYNISCWSIFTWSDPPIFSYKGRRNMSGLICERELFIEAMAERFKRWPDEEKIDRATWAEPGKYESQIDVTVRETEEFYTNPPNVMFTHEAGLSFHTIGKRKRLGELRALEIPYWGRADKMTQFYV